MNKIECLAALHRETARLVVKLARNQAIDSMDRLQIADLPRIGRLLTRCCGVSLRDSEIPRLVSPEGEVTSTICRLFQHTSGLLAALARSAQPMPERDILLAYALTLDLHRLTSE